MGFLRLNKYPICAAQVYKFASEIIRFNLIKKFARRDFTFQVVNALFPPAAARSLRMEKTLGVVVGEFLPEFSTFSESHAVKMNVKLKLNHELRH